MRYPPMEWNNFHRGTPNPELGIRVWVMQLFSTGICFWRNLSKVVIDILFIIFHFIFTSIFKFKVIKLIFFEILSFWS